MSRCVTARYHMPGVQLSTYQVLFLPPGPNLDLGSPRVMLNLRVLLDDLPTGHQGKGSRLYVWLAPSLRQKTIGYEFNNTASDRTE